MKAIRYAVLLTAIVALANERAGADAVELVRDGEAVAVIVVDPDAEGGGLTSDRGAAETLAEWIELMTGATLEIVDAAPDEGPAILVGAAAVNAGLDLDDIESPSREGLRIRTEGDRVLLAGQDGRSTLKAATRLLEELGCRFLMDLEMGKIYPSRETVVVEAIDITEQPAFLYRRIWGSGWGGDTLWKVWNGQGGINLGMGHAWGRYVDQDLFDEHPEYFALRNGERRRGSWYCTSNPELRRVFAEGVIRRIEEGTTHPSISPPDGRGFCECDDCRAQDDPDILEPTSGTISVTTRYVDFFNEVADIVAEAHPDTLLNFYVYSDYTQPPSEGVRLRDNIVAWHSPIRFCWLHSFLNDNCPSRVHLREVIDGWGPVADKMGWRPYNYNFGDMILPFSRSSTWAEQIPYLHELGMIGNNMESLHNWPAYGPHLYLSIRLTYDPQADADAILDDYFRQLLGPDAGPLIQQYWEEIDRAYVEAPAHNASFYALHQVFTPELIETLRSLMDQAAEAAADEVSLRERVAFFDSGLQNAEQYIEIRDAMNAGQFERALAVYEEMMSRVRDGIDQNWLSNYGERYPERFLGRHLREGAEATADPNRVVMVLPDEWRFAYEPEDGDGIEAGYARADFDDGNWKTVRTYSDPLDVQGVEERFTHYWYRTTIDVPEDVERPVLFFTEVDRNARVWVNGEMVLEESESRRPFEVDVGEALRAGEENQITVRVDHHRITTLFLGGIVRPVLLIDKAE